jgi:pSer/pThr/pTyr-binding forkhead associated (FHA) protein
LDIKVGELVGKQISVNATGAVIGRSEQEATHVLPISTVSKKHAKITFSNGKFFIEDLNSSNGVYINTIRITGPTLISHGNSFKIGGCEGHFLLK